MKIILILISFTGNNIFCQEASLKESNLKILRSLDNSSVIIVTNYFLSLKLDSNALEICKNLDDSSVAILLQFLSYNEKVLIAHVLLTNAFEPQKAGFEYEYNYVGSKVESTTFTMNDFSWTHLNGEIKKFDAEQIQRIKKYWESKHIKGKEIKGRCGGISKLKNTPSKQ